MSDSDYGGAGRAQQVGQTARQEASATAHQAKQAGGEVVDTATEQVKAVAGEAKDQARTVARDLRERLSDQAQSQTQRGADTLRQWADDLAGLASNAGSDSPAKSMVEQVADRGHRVADYLDQHGAGGVVGDVQDFARRRPGAFLGGAALAGFVVGRLAKAGSKAAGSEPGQPMPGEGGRAVETLPRGYGIQAEPEPAPGYSPPEPSVYPPPERSVYPPPERSPYAQEPSAYPQQERSAYAPQEPSAYPRQERSAYPPQEPSAYPPKPQSPPPEV
ncbi:hypothetical protein [Streptomyces sp.]|uniref:hypothetical protein n=1 Tax=Streptomyces sp. TaxID=1931 RepID=UPI002D3FC958|nr:hypothetical protein [Streptomyces sp.]HZF91436.1 hypothetical protein [Streptomyces sp.]